MSYAKKTRAHAVLKWVAIAAAALTLVTLIAGASLQAVYYHRLEKTQDERRASLKSIVLRLESDGLDDASKQMMQEHSAKYTDFSNFVVAQDDGHVLYSVNQAYVDAGGIFRMAIAKPSDEYGFVGPLAVLYDAQGLTVEKFRMEVYKGDMAPRGKLHGFAMEGTEYLLDSELDAASFGSAQISYDINVYYANIASKGMNLFFLYDANTPKWVGGMRYLDNLPLICGGIAVLGFLVYWLSLAIWVFIDASRRDGRPALWGVLTLLTNAVGLIIYLLTRAERPVCKACKHPLEQDFIACPMCGTRNRAQCPACKKLTSEEWRHCPYCGEALAKTDCSEITPSDPQAS